MSQFEYLGHNFFAIGNSGCNQTIFECKNCDIKLYRDEKHKKNSKKHINDVMYLSGKYKPDGEIYRHYLPKCSDILLEHILE